MKIYAISGLGADQRVFDYLKLNCEFIPIEWIQPLPNEAIEKYALRLAQVINSKEKFGILGVSFGGLVATEISKVLKPQFIILISSAETKKELRPIFRSIGQLNFLRFIPSSFFNPPRRIAHFLFGTSKRKLLNQILDDTDLIFAKWAVQELVNWKNEIRLENILKIHGTKDKLIPPPKDTTDMHLIEGGEHFMIVDRAHEISQIINVSILKNNLLTL